MSNAARVRLPIALVARLQDSAYRHRLKSAEIVRRACRKWHSASTVGVVALPDRKTTTRNESVVIVFADIPANTPLEQLGQIIAWYLDAHDTGTAATGPSMDGMTRCRADGAVEFVWPVSKMSQLAGELAEVAK